MMTAKFAANRLNAVRVAALLAISSLVQHSAANSTSIQQNDTSRPNHSNLFPPSQVLSPAANYTTQESLEAQPETTTTDVSPTTTETMQLQQEYISKLDEEHSILFYASALTEKQDFTTENTVYHSDKPMLTSDIFHITEKTYNAKPTENAIYSETAFTNTVRDVRESTTNSMPTDQDGDESEKQYVTISFITNNPKEKPTKIFESTTDKETTTEQYTEKTSPNWTIISESSTKKPSTPPGDSKETVFINIHNRLTVFKNNTAIGGHFVTVPPISDTENNAHKLGGNKKDCGSNNGTNIDHLKTSQESTTNSGDILNFKIPSIVEDMAKTSDDMEIGRNNSHMATLKDVMNSSFGSPSIQEHKFNGLSDEEMDILEASEYGFNKMNDLYGVQEPKLYRMGMWLEPDNPARYVAIFNWQSEEAKKLTRFGYAALQASTRLQHKIEPESRVSGGSGPARTSLVRGSALREQCPLRGDPRCPPASKRYRTHDGSCNNARRPRWGSALSPTQRFLPPAYADGLQQARAAARGGRLPSARLVSAAVHSPRARPRAPPAPAPTHMLMQWGQFLDHDVASSSQARGFNGSVPRCCADGGKGFVSPDFLHPECMPIVVPLNDPFYGPLGINCLEFVRSGAAPHAGCELGWREQLNQVSAYIDASPIYSSSARQSDKLRLFRNGFLQYGRVQARRPMLPREEEDEEALCRGGAVDASCFKAGDGRVNEHPGLVAMHIVWLRRHNRLATELSHLNPHWSDEKVYQETRKIIGALVQHITYKEFLPIVLGSEVIRLFDLGLLKKGYYDRYSSKVNPSPASSFATAAFRFGHSLVQDSFMRYDRFHRPLPNNVSLHEELSNPSNIWSFGAVDRLLLGLCNQPAQKRDEIITPELTNHLFQTSRFRFGMDLASINIQRGRDHGLPPYVDWREPCGLSQITEWRDLLNIMPSSTVQNMEEVYRDVEDIDLFTGGMAERPVIGGLVGPTFACIIAQQFSNLRRGDRFWYENGGFESSFTPAQLQQIRRVTLAHILCQTMENVDTLQPFVFLSPDDFRNERVSCDSNLLNNFELSPWQEREFDFDNDINNDFDRTNKPKIPSRRPQFPLHVDDNDSSETVTHSITDKKTTTEKKTVKDKRPNTDIRRTTPSPSNSILLDDKLDIPNRPTTTRLPDSSTETELTTEQTVKLDDKLDFSAKEIHELDQGISLSDTDDLNVPRSFTNDDSSAVVNPNANNVSHLHVESNNNTNMTDSSVAKYFQHNSTTGNVTDSDEPSLKTYGFLLSEASQIPFIGNFFSTLISTTPQPIIRPQFPQLAIQDEIYQTTEAPDKLTYLINIVPKTTPKYPNGLAQKETIKITIQAEQPHLSNSQIASYPFNKRPVYNNNKLEYRPMVDNSQSSYGGMSSIVNNDDLTPLFTYKPQKRPTPTNNDDITPLYTFRPQKRPMQSNNDDITPLYTFRPQKRPTQTNNDNGYFNKPSFSPSYDSIQDSGYFHNTQYINSQQGTNNQRPAISNNRPYQPFKPASNDYSTEYNPYSLVTFSHIETTKRHDLFNRPVSQYNPYENDYPTASSVYVRPQRPSIVSADNSYGINPRPVQPQQAKPINTGITIYIDNKPSRPKPAEDAFINSNYPQNTNDDDNVPLFTRPNYQRPLYNKPLTNSRPQYPKPYPLDISRPDSDREQNYNPFHREPTDNSGSPLSNNRPYQNMNSADSSNGNIHILYTSAKPPNRQKPTWYGKPEPAVSHQHNELSIVIDPNLRQNIKMKTKNTNPTSATHKPVKFYYIGNVLHKYTETGDSDIFEPKSTHSAYLKERKQIIKENYNNAWKPDKNEHKLFYGSYDDDSAEPYDGINGNMKDYEENKSNNSSEKLSQEIKNIDNFDDDLDIAFSEKREAAVNIPSKSENPVFFEVIPSENSPTMWAVYNEKPEENSLHSHHIMPVMDSDPHAIKELPHPLNFTAIAKIFKRKHL